VDDARHGFGAPAKAQTQEKQQHVVTTDELSQQVARPAETRQANEEAVRHLLSSDAGQNALKSANVDYARVDKAIGQLSDEEVAKLAERSRQARAILPQELSPPRHSRNYPRGRSDCGDHRYSGVPLNW